MQANAMAEKSKREASVVKNKENNIEHMVCQHKNNNNLQKCKALITCSKTSLCLNHRQSLHSKSP